MNLSTLDSNQHYKKRIIYLLLLILIFYCFANFLGNQYDRYLRKINNQTYLYRGDIQGKFDFIRSLLAGSRPDIIFIGNSVTGLHISTAFLYRNGIKSFNYANAGFFIAQYPTMIKNAIKLRPKMIAFSILLEDFYMPSRYYYDHYDHDTDVSYHALNFLIKHTNENAYFILSKFIISYLKNLNYFLNKGYIISTDIITKYNKYNGYRFLRSFFPKHPKYSSIYPSRFTFNCDFDNKGHRYPNNCFNGDFVMVGHAIKLFDYRKQQALINKDYNSTLVNIFNGFFDEIKRAGIEPILILIPSYNKFVVDQSVLKRSIHARIIDLSNIQFSKDYFADGVHYNTEGRRAYSAVLVNKLKPLVS